MHIWLIDHIAGEAMVISCDAKKTDAPVVLIGSRFTEIPKSELHADRRQRAITARGVRWHHT